MKRIISLILCLVMIFSLCACGSKGKTQDDNKDAEPSKPAVFQDKNDKDETPAPEAVEEPAKVVFYNADGRIDAELQSLAEKFKAEKGIEVTVKTVTEDYDNVLSAAIDSTDAPTVFTVNKDNFSKWNESCYALNDSPAAAKCLSQELNISENEQVKAIAYDYDAFGLAVNTRLLDEAGISAADIGSYAKFADAVAKIQNEFKTGAAGKPAAMAEPQLSGELWRYNRYCISPVIYFECYENGITEQPAYVRGDFLDGFRTLYELWIDNSPVSRWYLDGQSVTAPKDSFGHGRTVFFPCGSWEFQELADSYDANAADYSMLPLFMNNRNEDEFGASIGNVKYWCVNRERDDKEIEAAVSFLEYIESDSGLAAKTAMPFAGVTCANPLLAGSNALLAAGKHVLPSVLDYLPGEEWESNISEKLIKYTTISSDWVQYIDAFLIGWQTDYEAQHKY